MGQKEEEEEEEEGEIYCMLNIRMSRGFSTDSDTDLVSAAAWRRRRRVPV